MADRERPALVHLFEVAAAVMGLDEGHTRLELCFENGYLRRWFAHSGPRGAADLAAVDVDRLVTGLEAGPFFAPPERSS
jgi:hypothetical protein